MKKLLFLSFLLPLALSSFSQTVSNNVYVYLSNGNVIKKTRAHIKDITVKSGVQTLTTKQDSILKNTLAEVDSISFVAPAIDPPEDYQLVWHDEFDENPASTGSPLLPDANKWSYETGNGGWGNNEIENYVPGFLGSDTVAYVSNGTLKIKQIHAADGSVLSARMNTKKYWTYGYFEARLKLPSGKGTWPAFWMMPHNYTSWPADGEIDIMEEVGYDPTHVQSSIHCTNYYGGNSKNGRYTLNTAQSQFHVYACEWTPDYLKFYVDGTLIFTYTNDGSGKNTWPFNAPFYLKLNNAFGGNWGGAQGVDYSCLPNIYEIDYVRVFQKKI